MTMKKSLLLLSLLTLTSGAQAMPVQNQDANHCLSEHNISSTSTPNSHTIVFHMRDGSVWKNTLRNNCSGLRQDGFVHVNFGAAEYCGNKEIIRTVTTGSTCALGNFTQVKAAHPHS